MSFAIFYTPEFKRAYKKLSKNLRILVKQKGDIFSADPFHPSLKTHKLSGILKGFWIFSIDHRNRVVFEFIEKNQVLLHSVGDHSIYRNK